MIKKNLQEWSEILARKVELHLDEIFSEHFSRHEGEPSLLPLFRKTEVAESIYLTRTMEARLTKLISTCRLASLDSECKNLFAEIKKQEKLALNREDFCS